MSKTPLTLDLDETWETLTVHDPATGTAAYSGTAYRKTNLADVVKWARAHGIPFEQVEFVSRGLYTSIPLPVAIVRGEVPDLSMYAPRWRTLVLHCEMNVAGKTESEMRDQAIEIANRIDQTFCCPPGEPTLHGIRAISMHPPRCTPDDLYYDRFLEDEGDGGV